MHARLIFEDELLLAAVARMNRCSHLKIVIRDADTDAFVDVLEGYFPIKIRRGGNAAKWLYSLG